MKMNAKGKKIQAISPFISALTAKNSSSSDNTIQNTGIFAKIGFPIAVKTISRIMHNAARIKTMPHAFDSVDFFLIMIIILSFLI